MPPFFARAVVAQTRRIKFLSRNIASARQLIICATYRRKKTIERNNSIDLRPFLPYTVSTNALYTLGNGITSKNFDTQIIVLYGVHTIKSRGIERKLLLLLCEVYKCLHPLFSVFITYKILLFNYNLNVKIFVSAWTAILLLA